MIPHDNRYQGFKCQPYFIGLLLACSFAIFCQAHESILDAEIARNHETSAIHHAESGQQMQLIKPQEFEVHGEMGHFDEDLDAPFWHRSNEVSVGLHDGLSDEEISPDEAESPGPSVGHLLSRPQFDVRLQFGAMGDGITNDTDAFLAAWATACTNQSADVYVPSGYTFLVYPSTYSGPCQEDLRFRVDGTILAPTEISAWSGRNVRYWFLFQNLNNFTLLGNGTFNGRGQNWWACKRNGTCPEAPTGVTIYKSSNVTAQNVTFVDSAQIHINFQYVASGHANGLQIQAPPSSPNTDGIHISGTTDFAIQKCNVSTGDDCVSIVSGSHNIAVQDTYCGLGCHGISVGSLGANGEHANVTQVQVENCQLESTTNGLRIKTWQGGTGIAQNFDFRNIEMKNVSNPIIIDQYYCPPSQISEPCTNQTENVHIDLVKFTNISGTSASSIAVKFACSESVPCTNIYLEDINITRINGNPAKAMCTNAFGVAEGMEIPPSCLTTNSFLNFTPLMFSFNASPYKFLNFLKHIIYL